MAHSNLYAQLRRFVRRQLGAAQLERTTGIPRNEWLDASRTRRQLLELMAALGTAPLLGCSQSPQVTGTKTTDTTPIDTAVDTEVAGKTPPNVGMIAIVGGGLAGLHCALRLWQDYGVKSLVYDGQTRVGGRCHTDHDTFKKLGEMHCELGGEFIDSNHVTMRKLCKDFDLPLLDYNDDDPNLDDSLLVVQGKVWSEKSLRSAWKPLADAIAKAQQALPGGLAPTYDKTQGAETIDNKSLAQWLDEANVTGPLRTLVDVTYTSEFGLDPEHQSALNLLDMVDASASGIALLGDSDERYHLKAGNEALVLKMVAALPSGAIQLGHTLQKASLGSDGRVVLTFATVGGSNVEVKADRTVMALPFSALRHVDTSGLALPAIKAKSINTLAYGTNSKLMVGFKSRVWRKVGSNGTILTDLGFGACWETSTLRSTTDLGILTQYSGGKKGVDAGLGSAANQRDACLNQLDAIIAGSKVAATADAVRMHWPSVPWVEGSYSCYKPSHYTSIRGAEAAQVGSIHFCGEHTDLAMQGYLEGAVASGERVAVEIAKGVGLTSK